MKIRKTIAAIAAAAVGAAALCVPVSAEDSANVFVTISDGKLRLPMQSVKVTDIDGDGALTINDALIIAHEDNGMSGGYASEETDYGLSMTKLWGVENGGAYGYYVNDASAWSLADPVKDGDNINAFVYTDTAAYSDTYCFFDSRTAAANVGKKITLTLSGAGYDESWNPITVPVAGAELTLNGKRTGIYTDENGTAKFAADTEGEYVLSAVSDTQTLVPPVCIMTIKPAEQTAETPAADNNPVTGVSLAAVLPAASALAALAFRKRK